MAHGTATLHTQGAALHLNTLQADQAAGNHARLLYSYAEARALLGGVAVSTFAMWVASGIVHPVKIGPRRCFITHDELMRLVGGEVA